MDAQLDLTTEMKLLEYENQIILDAFHEDGLLVMAGGLGIERVFINFLKIYSDPKNLVLVLNTSQQEEEYFVSQLEKEDTKPLPKQVTADLNVNDRRDVYMDGGVLFVTSRILVVDFLTDRVPTDLITGILVYKAHKIIESCQEAFILRLYRQKNKNGFVKAFSESPQSFTAGFCKVERVMKSLFVRKLFLWPRFHASVSSCFDRRTIEVVELHLKMTPAMTACQVALLDLIDACIKELKRSNQSLDTDELTVENSLTRNFDKMLRIQLDPVWHQLGPKTRQLVSDIKTLRLMLQYLPQYDCVNFYNLVYSVRNSEKAFGSNAGWMFLDAADTLFVCAKQRVYLEKKDKKTKSGEDSKAEKREGNMASNTTPRRPVSVNSRKRRTPMNNPIPTMLEECPKWKVLREVLDEIESDNKKADDTLGPGRVLIAAQDDRTCSQIKEFLCDGGQLMLRRLFNKTIGFKTGAMLLPESRMKANPGKSSKAMTRKSNNGLTLTQMVDDPKKKEEDETGSFSEEAYYGVLQCPFTVLHPLHGSSDPYSLTRTLEEVEPRYVILYDADMSFVRQLEVFRAIRPNNPLRVYFLMYAGSTEEQRYLTTLRKEKEAFEFLIREKATMVIPEEREGRLENDPNLSRDTTPANETVNTRKGGVQLKPEQDKVIVDMREFRSELPALLHRRGIDIEPVTIEVGDYILTPDICVERKSVSDLIGSLNNGRLYNQGAAMCRYYKRPVLLIEFDPNKPFTLQGKYYLSSEINSNDVTSRLVLLTLHFPRLRILWCQSPYATAELFQEIKMGRNQPDAVAAMAISGDVESEFVSEKYNHGPQSMLMKMPGITSKNVFSVMNSVKDMAELVSLTEERLTEVLGSSAHARSLYSFIHKEQKPQDVDTGPVSSKYSKGAYTKGSRGGGGSNKRNPGASLPAAKRKTPSVTKKS